MLELETGRKLMQIYNEDVRKRKEIVFVRNDDEEKNCFINSYSVLMDFLNHMKLMVLLLLNQTC